MNELTPNQRRIIRNAQRRYASPPLEDRDAVVALLHQLEREEIERRINA